MKTAVLISLILLCAVVQACAPKEEPPVQQEFASTPEPAEELAETDQPTVAPPVELPTRLPGQKLPVLYDDDGSPDGTAALFYLLSHPQVEIVAVAVTYGEAYPQVYIQHLARQMDAFGFQDIPLGYGPDAPLAGSNGFPESWRQSANTFWGMPIPNPGKSYPARPAAELYVELINSSTEPLNLFISGPCTNLAQALRLDPGIRSHIAGVYIMGGAVYAPGNVKDIDPNIDNETAECNIYSDALAASEVFASGLDIYLVPLDATDQVGVSMEDTQQWRAGGMMANFDAGIFETMITGWGVERVPIWDLLTAAVMVQPDLCGFQALPLKVITEDGNTSGQTALIEGMTPNVNVCLQPDVERVKRTLVDVFTAQVDPTSAGEAQTATPELSTVPEVSATPENLVFYEGFDGSLQPGWTWENERPPRWSLSGDGWLEIVGEDAGLLYGQAQSNLLWHDLPQGDFAITVHLDASPSANYQQAAIYIYEDPENYVAINRGFCAPCLQGGQGIFMEYKIGGAWGAYNVAYEAGDVYLRLLSEDNTISGYYAAAPGEWQRLGRFGNYFSFRRVGLGVSNLDREGDDAAELVGRFDFFEITRP